MEVRTKNWVLPLWLSLAMVLALAIRIALIWSELPDSMASHFSGGGRPDAFMSRGGFFIAMALIGGGSVAAVFAAPILLRITPPRLLNIPNRRYWLANDERRDAALNRLADSMGWMGAATTALLVIAVELTIQANLERRNLDEATFLFFLVLYFAFVIVWLVRMLRMFRIPEAAP